ncbi:serine protease snake-like [Ischnura elegans]|uniref:serine protease snake-like n=1 Tax=Ischnura elegans TaxID=197161 RepID=UPI001ED89E8C|nr:serine protease snake-like [Ischnura elegans]
MDSFRLLHCALLLLELFILGSTQYYSGDQCRGRNGRRGVCLDIYDCPRALEMLEYGIYPRPCGFFHSDPLVCCTGRRPRPPSTSATTHRPPFFTTTTTREPPPTSHTTPAPPGPNRKVGEAAKYYCDRYREFCPLVPVVAGGIKATPDEFPHMAAIGYGDESNIQWACGGTLISDRFVLTAAHCLRGGRLGLPRWVLLATELLKGAQGEATARRGQTHPVVNHYRHPDYKPPAKYHDIALLEIGAALEPGAIHTMSRELHPACLDIYDHSRTISKAIATGWGRTGFGEDASPDLLKVDIQILQTSICNNTYEVEIKSTNALQRGIDSTMICAGNLEGGKDTCQGDSGGPLQIGLSRGCLYEVVGVTSFGKVCAFANSPAIYTRVHEYIEWIENIVWPVQRNFFYFF